MSSILQVFGGQPPNDPAHIALSASLTPEEIERLYRAIRETLALWTERLRKDAGDDLPEKVTAFREGCVSE